MFAKTKNIFCVIYINLLGNALNLLEDYKENNILQTILTNLNYFRKVYNNSLYV